MMRNIRTLMVAIALFFGATTMLTAQVKIAHIDVQKLLEEMPERKSIEAQLKKLEQGYTADIQAAIKELQARADKYQKEAAIEAAQQTEKQLKTQWINLQEEYQLNLQKYQFYKQEALPEAERIIRANQLGYSAGEISYVEYLYTLQTAVDTRLAYLESIEALNQKVIEIQSLLNQ